MKRIICLALVVLFIDLPVFAQDAAQTKQRPVLVKEIHNFHMVTPGIMRGSQPKDEAFELLKEYAGVKTVIDLRNEEWQIEKERGVVGRLGMVYVSVPMKGNEKVSPEVINQVLSIMTDRSNQPVFIHCMAGKDRTGLVMAAYRIKLEHWSQDDAVKEMLAYGYDRGCCSAMEESLAEWKDQLK